MSFSSLCSRVGGYDLVSPGLWSRSVVRIWVGWWFLCLVVVSRSREALFLPSLHVSLGRGSLGAFPAESKWHDEVVCGS